MAVGGKRLDKAAEQELVRASDRYEYIVETF